MLAFIGLAAALAGSQRPASPAARLPDCEGQLSIGFDGENGNFNGMSHSGVLLVVRNLGPGACRTPGLPALRMQDGAGRALAFAREAPLDMHPGPVVVPVAIPAGAEATSALYWVSGDVYDGHNCATPARIAVTTGEDTATLPWPGGAVCGPAGRPIPYRQPVLRLDPELGRGGIEGVRERK